MSAGAGEAVLLIGAGRMGSALLKGWIGSGRFSALHVIDPEPSEWVRSLAAAKTVSLSASLGDTPPPAAAIVLAMKPQVLKTGHAALRMLGQSGALAVSIAAGVTCAFLAEALGPGARLVRAMPNTPGAIGKGISALYGTPSLSTADRALAETLLSALGETLWIGDEALMDAVTALSGSGPAYVFLMAEAMAEAGRAEGLDPETALRLARATVTGAGALLAAETRSPADLRRDVTSPGGTTEAALRVLMADDGLAAVMRRAIAAAARRGRELGKP